MLNTQAFIGVDASFDKTALFKMFDVKDADVFDVELCMNGECRRVTSLQCYLPETEFPRYIQHLIESTTVYAANVDSRHSTPDRFAYIRLDRKADYSRVSKRLAEVSAANNKLWFAVQAEDNEIVACHTSDAELADIRTALSEVATVEKVWLTVDIKTVHKLV